MNDYQKMYSVLFNEVTTSIELLTRQRDALTGEIDRLKYVQNQTEELFLEAAQSE